MGNAVCADIHNSVIDERPGGINDLSFDELVVKFHSYSILNKESRVAAELVLQQQVHTATDFSSHINKVAVIFKQFKDSNQEKNEDTKLDLLSKIIEFLPNHLAAFDNWKIQPMEEKDRTFTLAVKYISKQAHNHVATIASSQYALAAAAKSSQSSVAMNSKSVPTPIEPCMVINGFQHYFCFAHEGLKQGSGWGTQDNTHPTSTCRFVKRNAEAKAKK
jgi:hypothetical protein